MAYGRRSRLRQNTLLVISTISSEELKSPAAGKAMGGRSPKLGWQGYARWELRDREPLLWVVCGVPNDGPALSLSLQLDRSLNAVQCE